MCYLALHVILIYITFEMNTYFSCQWFGYTPKKDRLRVKQSSKICGQPVLWWIYSQSDHLGNIYGTNSWFIEPCLKTHTINEAQEEHVHPFCHHGTFPTRPLIRLNLSWNIFSHDPANVWAIPTRKASYGSCALKRLSSACVYLTKPLPAQYTYTVPILTATSTDTYQTPQMDKYCLRWLKRHGLAYAVQLCLTET